MTSQMNKSVTLEHVKIEYIIKERLNRLEVDGETTLTYICLK
jgi:hypothetical protein